MIQLLNFVQEEKLYEYCKDYGCIQHVGAEEVTDIDKAEATHSTMGTLPLQVMFKLRFHPLGIRSIFRTTVVNFKQLVQLRSYSSIKIS